MSNSFEQISFKHGFMKHNGGILYRDISETEYEFKTTINENHLNTAGITHGGFICSLIDAGAGTAAHRCVGNAPCVTISLDVKFISTTKKDDEIIGIKSTSIKFKNNVKVFVGSCYILCVLFILILCLMMKIDKYLLVFSIFFIMSLIYQIRIFKIDNQKSCLAAFKINNLTGIFVFVFIFSFIFS